MIKNYESLLERIKKKILEKINNNEKHDNDIKDGLYYKNILIVYYKKALNLYYSLSRMPLSSWNGFTVRAVCRVHILPWYAQH